MENNQSTQIGFKSIIFLMLAAIGTADILNNIHNRWMQYAAPLIFFCAVVVLRWIVGIFAIIIAKLIPSGQKDERKERLKSSVSPWEQRMKEMLEKKEQQ